MSEKLTDISNDDETTEERPLTPEDEFEREVCDTYTTRNKLGLVPFGNSMSNILAGQQISFATANILMYGATPLATGALLTSLALAGTMKYTFRNEVSVNLHAKWREPVQEKIGARHELYRINNPEYDKNKPQDVEDNPKHVVGMHYYGAFERQSRTTLEDAQRIIALAKENKVAKVYMPAALSTELGIFDEAFAETSVHDELQKHVGLSKRTAVVDTKLKCATPEEWLIAIEKSDASLGVDGLLQTISDLNPSDPLVKIWGDHKGISQSAHARTVLYQTLYKQLRMGFERQLHDTEIDSAQLREARLAGHAFDKSKAVSHLHGEVRQGKVYWRSQTGQELDIDPLKAALGLSNFDARAMQEVLAGPCANPQLAQRVAEYMLFSVIHNRLSGRAGDQAQLQDDRGPVSIYDHHNGAVKPFIENIKQTKEYYRGKPLMLRLGCIALGATVAAVPAILFAPSDYHNVTEGGLSSGEIGNIGESKNLANWTLDEHGLEASGYWGATTGQKLTIAMGNDGQPVFKWEDVLLDVETTQDLPSTLPASTTHFIEVGHQMAAGDATRIQSEDGWSMRVPVRQGLDIAAASMGSYRLAVQHRADGTTWLHGEGNKMPDSSETLKYWLVTDADAPKPKAFAQAQVEDMIAGRDQFPELVIAANLPKYVRQGDPASSLKRYIQSEWEYDLAPLPNLRVDTPLESFVAKAISARKANCNVANTLEALYSPGKKRAVVSGYYVDKDDKALYSHSAHTWTADEKGNILDATPYKGGDKFDSYFASPKNTYWSTERIAQVTMIGTFALGGLGFAGMVSRRSVRRWRYDSAVYQAQSIYKELDNGMARRAIATIEQALYAPSFRFSDVRLQVEKSQKTSAHLMAAQNAVMLAPATESRIKEIYNKTEVDDDKVALQETLTAISVARKLIARRQKLEDKAKRLHNKLSQDV